MSNGGGAVVAILGLVLLSGCIAEERARAVRLDKGGYAGAVAADQVISDATREALRQRVAPQAEGAGKVMVSADAAVMPSGEAAASGRIAGQKF